MTTTQVAPTRPSTPTPPPQRGFGLALMALGLVATAAVVLALVFGMTGLRGEVEELESLATAAATPAAAAAPVAAAEEAAPAGPEIEVALELTEFEVVADVEEIPAFATVHLTATNTGTIPHDARVGDDGTPLIDAGDSADFTVDAPGSGSLRIFCSVAGHEDAGMQLDLPIAATSTDTATAAPADAAESIDAAESADAGDSADAGEAAAAASADNAAAYEGERPDLVRRDPEAPPPSTATVHDVTWTVQETVMQVAPDVWQQVWTFEGQAPGPTLRIKVGDTVNLTLVNPDTNGLGHSIDFHASQVAWNDEMRTIAPGEELTYTFTATHAGIFMYHCGTAPALHHIGNQMLGMIIVEPAAGLPPVDREFAFVQSEYYLGPQGEPGSLEHMSHAAADPSLVVFNGVAGQYAEEPIHVEVGERIRTFVLNAGPSVDSSYHIVGTIFDVAVKEGIELVADNPGGWGSQAIDLAPAQGGYAEFSLAEDGLYPIVTHAFNYVGLGALGLFEAGTGGAAAEGGH